MVYLPAFKSYLYKNKYTTSYTYIVKIKRINVYIKITIKTPAKHNLGDISIQ